MSLRERDFALAAQAVGAGHVMIMWRHILPNALPVIIPTLSLCQLDTFFVLEGLELR
jgi:ABC-type dipeptide/oligopeptide/nickel transport system permease subunit